MITLVFRNPVKFGGEYLPANASVRVAKEDAHRAVKAGADLPFLVKMGTSLHGDEGLYDFEFKDFTHAQLVKLSYCAGLSVTGRPNKNTLWKHFKEVYRESNRNNNQKI